MKNKLIVLCLACVSTSCGTSIHNIDNCIPETTFVSTKETGFKVYKLAEKFVNEAYDEISIGKSQDWYLDIIDLKNSPYTENTDDSYLKNNFPEGVKLKLSGKAKISDAWGLMAAFRSDIIYLHGTIENKNVWTPVFMFRKFKDSKNSSNEFHYRNSELDKVIENRVCN